MDLLRAISTNISKQRALLAEAKKDLQKIHTIQAALQETLNDGWNSAELPALTQSPSQGKAFIDLVASGRVLSVAAQANEALGTGNSTDRKDSWIGNGRKYSRWLGQGVVSLCKDSGGDETKRQFVADLCGKSFFLGYADDIVETITASLLLGKPRFDPELQNLIKSLKTHEQRRFVLSVIENTAKRHLSASKNYEKSSDTTSRCVSGCAALLNTVISVNTERLGTYLSEWLMNAPNSSMEMYRAIIIALPAADQDRLLEQVWTKFSDKMFMKHAPVVQQEHLAKAILLLAGHAYRRNPMTVFVAARSSTQIEGVSNRLSSSSPRVRFLGMAVASAISQLIDKPETRMSFEFEGEDKIDFNSFCALLKVDDGIGSLDDLARNDSPSSTDSQAITVRPKPAMTQKGKPPKPTAKIQIIEEDEDDDLVPYAKPDSDPEDNDEDPTLVQRKKLKAAVYIRDLITQLGNTEDADTQHLALAAAPSLIRRKADFGSELSDRAIELCASYFNLSDPFGLEDFLELRLQGMIALLIAQPQTCGPYFASAVFESEFSVSQRVAGLTAIGLSARELAGYKPADSQSEKQFPSKTLPERLHKLYLQDTGMGQLSKQLTSNMLNSVSTSQKRNQRKLIRNDLSKVLAESFFFPLTSSFAAHSHNRSSTKNILPTYTKTIAIILTSAGPNTPALPQLTAESFSLLLSLRARALNDSATLEALLFGFLSVLNVNENRRLLAERHAREIVEVHEWCNTVFERFSSGQQVQGVSDEEERVKTLCAGVLVATKEVINNYERLMLGDLVDFGG